MTEIVKQATMRNPAFWVCLAMTIALLLGGFFTQPRAKIDGSVLTACGILFGNVGTGDFVLGPDVQ